MTLRWLRLTALAAILGLGLGTGVAHADGYCTLPLPPASGYGPYPPPPVIHNLPPAQGQVQPQVVQPESLYSGTEVAPGRAHPVRDALHIPPQPVRTGFRTASDVTKHALEADCWGHFNMFGCGSLQSEWVFAFGSCRDFFGQPCMKQPPEDMVAPMYGPPGAAAAAGYSTKPVCPFCK